MLCQANLKRTFRILSKSWKNIGVLRFVPFIVLNVLIPIVNIASYRQYGVSGEFQREIVSTALMFLPFFAAWWPMFFLREYIEADGNELLAFFHNKKQEALCFCTHLIYLANVSALFFVYIKIFPELKLFYLWIIIVCVFYFSLSYFMSFATKSVTLTLMSSLIYAIANQVIISGKIIFMIYSTAGGYVFLEEWKKIYLPLVILSIVFLAVGFIFKEKYPKYN